MNGGSAGGGAGSRSQGEANSQTKAVLTVSRGCAVTGSALNTVDDGPT